jgi:hypothetical protein
MATVGDAIMNDTILIPQTEASHDDQTTKETDGKIVSPFDADFAKYVEETMKKWHIPGLSIAVIDGPETFSEVRTGNNVASTTNAYPGIRNGYVTRPTCSAIDSVLHRQHH